MNFDKLDQDELLRLALDALHHGRDADAVVMLKSMLEREPRHTYALHLLAAQHAQLGMFDRAEAGFRAAVSSAPDFPVARFQLAQLLVMKGALDEAKATLAPLVSQGDALGAYARALCAAADDNADDAVRELESGLALPQEIPALAADMRRLGDTLRGIGSDLPPANVATTTTTAPIFLTGYGRDA